MFERENIVDVRRDLPEKVANVFLGGDFVTKADARQATNGVAVADALNTESGIARWLTEAKIDLDKASKKIPGFEVTAHTASELDKIAGYAVDSLYQGATWQFDLIQREVADLGKFFDEKSKNPSSYSGHIPGFKKSTGPGSIIYFDEADQLAHDTLQALKELMKNVPGFRANDVLADTMEGTTEFYLGRANRLLERLHQQESDPFSGMSLPKVTLENGRVIV